MRGSADEQHLEKEKQNEPSNKKKRTENFIKGSVVRITVQNFLTYDQCTFRLNPKLNVIIGPNGTGKSSIVCAICIGLGGKTSILARAKEIVDFIKHGEDNAMVELEISSHPKNEVVRRDIMLTANGKAISSWQLNGNQTNIKQIEELTSRLNIQLSNLCQFLPQERVSDFARMNKIELLENTELAICSSAMQNDHAWLKEFRNTEKNLESKIADDKAYLEKLVQKNERVEKEVRRFNERNALTVQLKNLKLKRSWMVYESARCQYIELKKAHQKLLEQCKDEEKKTLPLQNEKEEIVNRMTTIDKLMKAKGEVLRSAAALTKRLHDQLNEKDEEVSWKWDEYKEKEKDEAGRRKKIEQYQLQISGWKHELNQLEEMNVQDKIDQLSHDIRSTLAAIGQIEHEQSIIQDHKEQNQQDRKRFEAKLSELNNLNKQRLESLRRRNRDCYNATIWLQANKSMFKSPIYGPILLMLKMKNPDHAELVENHIAMRDMYAFVCENQEDNQKLIYELREKQGLRVNVVRAPLTSNGMLVHPTTFKPQRLIENVKKWGFVSYLRESIEAPDSVMAFLCKQYRIHDIPIGSAHTKRMVDEVTQSSGFSLFFIPSVPRLFFGCRYSVRTSKYSEQKIVGNSALRRAEFMNIDVNPDELKKIHQELEKLTKTSSKEDEHLKELILEKRFLEKKDNQLKKQKKELLGKRNERKNLESKISLKESNLNELEQSGIDLGALKQQAQQEVKIIIEQKKELAIKFVSKIKSCVETSVEKGISQVDYACALKRKMFIEEQIHEIKMRNQELIRALERCESDKIEAQKQAKDLLAEAKQMTGGGPDKLDQECGDLPDDLPEIEAKIHECQARLECCGSTDPKVVREFKLRSKEILKLENKLSRISSELQCKRDEMETVKARWLTPLKELVTRINERFSRYFSKMGCAGEVDLHADNEDDFDKYGIRIRVKFRSSSSLQELNPFRQSGGERSVSTMLYLVALQSMYVCPFRVVDEINQGMDPSNERRVFEVIVNASSEEDSTSQYFLITPKLLPQLTYNRHMTVHCVYNGPHMLPQKNWKVSRFVRRRKQLEYEDGNL